MRRGCFWDKAKSNFFDSIVKRSVSELCASTPRTKGSATDGLVARFSTRT